TPAVCTHAVANVVATACGVAVPGLVLGGRGAGTLGAPSSGTALADDTRPLSAPFWTSDPVGRLPTRAITITIATTTMMPSQRASRARVRVNTGRFSAPPVTPPAAGRVPSRAALRSGPADRSCSSPAVAGHRARSSRPPTAAV